MSSIPGPPLFMYTVLSPIFNLPVGSIYVLRQKTFKSRHDVSHLVEKIGLSTSSSRIYQKITLSSLFVYFHFVDESHLGLKTGRGIPIANFHSSALMQIYREIKNSYNTKASLCLRFCEKKEVWACLELHKVVGERDCNKYVYKIFSSR